MVFVNYFSLPLRCELNRFLVFMYRLSVNLIRFVFTAFLMVHSAFATTIGGEGKMVESSESASFSPGISKNEARSYSIPPGSIIQVSSLPPEAPLVRVPAEPSNSITSGGVIQVSSLPPEAPSVRVPLSRSGVAGQSPDDVAKYWRMIDGSVLALNGGRPQDALAVAIAADRVIPGQDAVFVCKGLALAALKRTEEAGKAFDAALQIAPDNVWSRFNRASFRLANRDYAGARADFEKCLAADPGGEFLRFNVVLTFVLEENIPAAQAEAEKIAHPGNTAAYYCAQVAIATAQGQNGEASGWNQSALNVFGNERCRVFYEGLRRTGLLRDSVPAGTAPRPFKLSEF